MSSLSSMAYYRNPLELTEKQGEVYDFIREYIDSYNGISPSYREIADEFTYGHRNNAKKICVALRKKGLIEWNKGQRRSIKIIKGMEPIY